MSTHPSRRDQTGLRQAWRGMAGLGREMRDLLLPRGCAGCDRPDTVLCESCVDLFDHDVIRSMPTAVMASGRVHACGIYRGAVRRAVLMWKDHDDQELDGEFAVMITRCLLRSNEFDGFQNQRNMIAVVPAPSARSSMRRRGRFHTALLAQAVADGLRLRGVPARCVPALSITGTTAKSVQSSKAGERANRLRNRLHVNRDLLQDCSAAVLVDDIITTGSTIRQCAKALNNADMHVHTGFMLAAVPAPSER